MDHSEPDIELEPLLTAAEARAIPAEPKPLLTGPYEAQQRRAINQAIQEAAKQGRFSIRVTFKIYPLLCEELRQKGFTLTGTMDRGAVTTLSWQQGSGQ